MILSDGDIADELQKGALRITPMPKVIQPASVDLHLGKEFRIFVYHDHPVILPGAGQDLTSLVTLKEGKPDFILHPGEFVLGCTQEYIEIPPYLAGKLEGKSSLGRIGLQCHATAGFFDPGFRGVATLELSNIVRLPIRLTEGMPIAQMAFSRLTRPAVQPYGSPGLNSHYQDQTGPDPSRFPRHPA